MLKKYESKRHFEHTPEPAPAATASPGEGSLLFTVHKHAARRLHYDLRLELDGVLKSWAVPIGPSSDPKVKRLAVMVEDHPLEYASFEGTIPQGEYGAGPVIIWDRGHYSPEADRRTFSGTRTEAERLMRESLAKGKVSLYFRGQKMRGSWTLVKVKHREKDWLLVKHQDEFARPDKGLLKNELSILAGLSIEDIPPGSGPAPQRIDPAKLPGARPSPFPTPVLPMLATLTGAAFNHPEWIFEPKLDGFRMIALKQGNRIRLLSRRGLDNTARYPHIATTLLELQAEEIVLDGEIVALDELGRPCFQCLQQHLKLERESVASGAARPYPIIYYVFDIVYLDGHDLTRVPLRQRKDILSATVPASDRIRLLDYFEGEGQLIFGNAVSHGFEGIVAKRRDSIYETGRRSRSWLKIKAVLSDEFVIGGYSQGQGMRGGAFGALLVGQYGGTGRLVYAGHVGTGFDERTLAGLKKALDALQSDACPFAETPPLNAPTVWVRPDLVAEVKFSQRTRDGLLRMPVFLRLREDKPAREVRRAERAPAPKSPSLPQNVVQGFSLASVDRPTRRAEAGPCAPHDSSKKKKKPGAVPVEEVSADVLRRLQKPGDTLSVNVEGHEIPLNNLGKELWPAFNGRRALTKRDLLRYLARVSPHLLPHLRDRPITLKRYPDGIRGEYFYQKHWPFPLPEFVETVNLPAGKGESGQPYLLCNNLPTLLWLGQLADIELHTWFSRITPDSDLRGRGQTKNAALLDCPDFIIFDLDPYIYAGTEASGAEPELNRTAFQRTCEVAFWLKELLDSLALPSFAKTSGRTGLHVYAPIVRQFDYYQVHAAAETIGRFLQQKHPEAITLDWGVEKRTGMVFFDYNQNVYGKTLASVYSPRATPEATVSTPVGWTELTTIFPTDFTILTVPDRLATAGDPWRHILEARSDLKSILAMT